MKTFTVKKGKFAARPYLFNIKISLFQPFSGRWRVVLGHGWDYELSTNHNQWNKACGDSFRLIDSSRQSVMLGVRRNEINGLLEVSPYYNIDGKNFYYESMNRPDEWPVVPVIPGQVIDFSYQAQHDGTVISRIYMPDFGGTWFHTMVGHHAASRSWIRREVNFYFGGSVPAPHMMTVQKERIKGRVDLYNPNRFTERTVVSPRKKCE